MKNKEKSVKEPLFHIVKRTSVPWWKSWLIRAAAILLAFVVTGLLSFFVLKKNPFFIYSSMFSGIFGTERRILIFLRDGAILLLIALAITPAFKMRFWNTGAEGQVLMGGFACTVCMFYLGGKVPDGVLIPIMFVAGVAAGMLWAVIPAIFKAKWNTNETLFTLMMNYVAMQIVLFAIKIWYPTGSGNMSPLPHGNLPQIGGGDFWLSVIVVTIVTALVYIYMKYSKQGYEISVVGESENTARYVGINVKKVVVRTLLISGAICGLAGFLIVGGIDHMISKETVGGRGFTAILVSWLAKFNPIFMIFTAYLVVFLQKGMGQVMTDCGVANAYFADIITGIMFFFIIGCEFFILYQIKFRKAKKRKKEEKEKCS